MMCVCVYVCVCVCVCRPLMTRPALFVILIKIARHRPHSDLFVFFFI